MAMVDPGACAEWCVTAAAAAAASKEETCAVLLFYTGDLSIEGGPDAMSSILTHVHCILIYSSHLSSLAANSHLNEAQ
jgi:hypothetical protein